MKYHKENGVLVDRPVHEWFGLTYANYFVVPRVLLQEQPLDWQRRFIALMDEISDDLGKTPEYMVLRDELGYLTKIPDDPEDEDSRVTEVHIGWPDPWADYRRGSVAQAAGEDTS